MQEKISPHDVIARYEKMQDIWPASDTWHTYTHKAIHRTVKRWMIDASQSGVRVLNIGSGGSDYELAGIDMVHGDLCIRNLSAGNSTVCNAENLPFQDATFDTVVCVGSVLNYCDALVALSEMARVIKPAGTLILEFEKSDNFEFIFSKTFCSNATMVTTFYGGEEEKVWVYNERYIKSLLNSLDLNIQRRLAIHTLSSAMLRVLPNQVAAKFGNWDLVLAKLPLFNRFASNVIVECLKHP